MRRLGQSPPSGSSPCLIAPPWILGWEPRMRDLGALQPYGAQPRFPALEETAGLQF